MKIEQLLLGTESSHLTPGGETGNVDFATPFARAVAALGARAEDGEGALPARMEPAPSFELGATHDFLFLVEAESAGAAVEGGESTVEPRDDALGSDTVDRAIADTSPSFVRLPREDGGPRHDDGPKRGVLAPNPNPDLRGSTEPRPKDAPKSSRRNEEVAMADSIASKLPLVRPQPSFETPDRPRELDGVEFVPHASPSAMLTGQASSSPEFDAVMGFSKPSVLDAEVSERLPAETEFEPIELFFVIEQGPSSTLGAASPKPTDPTPSFATELAAFVEQVASEIGVTRVAHAPVANETPRLEAPPPERLPQAPPPARYAPNELAPVPGSKAETERFGEPVDTASEEHGSIERATSSSFDSYGRTRVVTDLDVARARASSSYAAPIAAPIAAPVVSPNTGAPAAAPVQGEEAVPLRNEREPSPTTYEAMPTIEPFARVRSVYERILDARPLTTPVIANRVVDPPPAAAADASLVNPSTPRERDAPIPPSTDGTSSAETPSVMSATTHLETPPTIGAPISPGASVYARIAETLAVSAGSAQREVGTLAGRVATNARRPADGREVERQGSVEGVRPKTARVTRPRDEANEVLIAPERPTRERRERSFVPPETADRASTGFEASPDAPKESESFRAANPIASADSTEVAPMRSPVEPPAPSTNARRTEEAPLAKAVAPSPFLKGLERTENLAEATAARAIAQLRQGGPAVLDIDHPFHGPIRLELAVDPRGIAVRAVALSEASARVIRATEPGLRENISRRGLVLKKLEVTVDGEEPSAASRPKVRRKGSLSMEV